MAVESTPVNVNAAAINADKLIPSFLPPLVAKNIWRRLGAQRFSKSLLISYSLASAVGGSVLNVSLDDPLVPVVGATITRRNPHKGRVVTAGEAIEVHVFNIIGWLCF